MMVDILTGLGYENVRLQSIIFQLTTKFKRAINLEFMTISAIKYTTCYTM